ncbi:MAG: hypothetical protein ABIH72_04435 [archaeon]
MEDFKAMPESLEVKRILSRLMLVKSDLQEATQIELENAKLKKSLEDLKTQVSKVIESIIKEHKI